MNHRKLNSCTPPLPLNQRGDLVSKSPQNHPQSTKYYFAKFSGEGMPPDPPEQGMFRRNVHGGFVFAPPLFYYLPTPLKFGSPAQKSR